ncbi:hypothetical protein [Actinomadura rugatobispora]|uniref:Uncharacterized protein n=1 Tax=Actinomadura rugatobispora TaxID=1994 RepID=A0ABW1AA33_9ACTN
MRSRAVLPLLAFVLCLFGLIYEPGAPALRADGASAAAALAGPVVPDAAPHAPAHETGGDPAFLANHAQAAAAGDHPASHLALPPRSAAPYAPRGPLTPRASDPPPSADPHAETGRARAPPASAGS